MVENQPPVSLSTRKTLARVLSGVLLLPLVSCASYTQRVAGAMSAFQAGNFDQAAEAFRDEERTDSEFLSGAESGTSAWAAGGLGERRHGLHAGRGRGAGARGARAART